MTVAGEIIVAGKIPGDRIATSVSTADGPDLAAGGGSLDVLAVTGNLVGGRTYRVTFNGLMSSAAGSSATWAIREGLGTGSTLTSIVRFNDTGAGLGYPVRMQVEYTPSTTGAQTFTVIMEAVGVGPARSEAAVTRPAYLYIDYVYGP